MAEQVVDLLEAVEVEAEQRQAAAIRRCRRDLAIELVVEAAAVGQAGQRIVLGEVAQVGLGLFAGAHIAHGDRVARLVCENHRPCDEFDADHARRCVAQVGLDDLAGMAKQACTHRFVGNEGRKAESLRPRSSAMPIRLQSSNWR